MRNPGCYTVAVQTCIDEPIGSRYASHGADSGLDINMRGSMAAVME